MAEKQFLMELQCDYSDEFDVYGLEVVSQSEVDEIMDKIERAEYPIEAGFGTNESLFFESPSDAKDSFKLTEMTDEEVAVFKKFIPGQFGFIPEFVSWVV